MLGVPATGWLAPLAEQLLGAGVDDRVRARGASLAADRRRVLLRADPWKTLDRLGTCLPLEGAHGGRGGRGSLYLATRNFASSYVVNVLELPSEDVAIALGTQMEASWSVGSMGTATATVRLIESPLPTSGRPATRSGGWSDARNSTEGSATCPMIRECKQGHVSYGSRA
jgi:hypothetical protein